RGHRRCPHASVDASSVPPKRMFPRGNGRRRFPCSPRRRRYLQLDDRIRGDQMSEIRKQGRSSKARRNRTIRIAPMTKAVRSALATSTLVLALGAAGNVSAADHALSRAQVQLLRFEQATLDTAPVFDLTTVPQGLIGPGAPAQSLIGPGDGG